MCSAKPKATDEQLLSALGNSTANFAIDDRLNKDDTADADLNEVAEMADPSTKMKRGSRKRSTILTSPRGVNTNNSSQVKTLLGS